MKAVNDEEEQSKRKCMVNMRSGNTLSSSLVIEENEMESHFQICVKMFTENKITSKNAWSLKIIDYMHFILSSNEMALQVASTSLDIGAKIYGIRVDNVCSDANKLSHSIARIVAKTHVVEDEISDEVYKNKAGNYSNNVAKQKTKTKLHLNHKNTITNDFSLNLCDISKLPSPLFYNYNSNIKILLTNQLHINRDGYVLLLLSKDMEWNTSENEDCSILCDEKYPFSIEPPQIPICQTFVNFQFDIWDSEEINGNNLDEVVYDENEIPIVELDGSVHDVFADAGKSPEEEKKRSSTLNITQNEYRTNHLIKQIWAGPSHWKLKCVRPAVTTFSGQSITRKIRKSKTEPKCIDFLSEIPKLHLSKPCKTMKNINMHVDYQKYNLPLNLALDNQFLIRLMLKPELILDVKNMERQNIDNLEKEEHYNHDFPETNFMEENLVDVQPVQYVLHEKKVNMKKLKQTLWKFLLDKNLEQSGKEEVKNTDFATVYTQLNNSLSSKLNFPLAFAVLLHLTNEHNLKLESINANNCMISQDYKPVINSTRKKC